MKELIVVLFVVAIGFGYSIPGSTKVPSAYYPGTFKGGIQNIPKHEPVDVIVPGVEGTYDYLHYIKSQLGCKKGREE